MKTQIGKIIITLILMVLAAISPNLFVLAQAGIAPLSLLVIRFLLPAIVLIFIVILISKVIKYSDIAKLAFNGIIAGIISTIALEIIREAGFRLGMMPGDMPKLIGVLILNRFASGPDLLSNLAGWSYHFWNGASFGLIFSLLFGQSKLWHGLLFGLLIGFVFMISPVVKSLGVGLFGLDFKNGYQFAATVILAHIGFGLTLGYLLKRWNNGIPDIFLRWGIKK